MHISEGVLRPEILAAGWAVAGAGVAIGLKKLEPEKITRTALVSSAFFLASLINIRFGPSSTHLSLLAPAGLLLGWQVFPAMLAALFLQSVLFNFGGFLVLGVNLTCMALPALIVYILFKKIIINKNNKIAFIVAFTAGFFAILAGAFLVGVFLGISDKNFVNISKIIFIAHLPLALIEGFITAFLISWLKKSAPEFLL